MSGCCSNMELPWHQSPRKRTINQRFRAGQWKRSAGLGAGNGRAVKKPLTPTPPQRKVPSKAGWQLSRKWQLPPKEAERKRPKRRMKSVRFSKVVEKCGQPEVYL